MTTKTYRTGNTWSVGSKKYAISDPSAAIALHYGKNVSKGIQEMEACLEDTCLALQCDRCKYRARFLKLENKL